MLLKAGMYNRKYNHKGNFPTKRTRRILLLVSLSNCQPDEHQITTINCE